MSVFMEHLKFFIWVVSFWKFKSLKCCFRLLKFSKFVFLCIGCTIFFFPLVGYAHCTWAVVIIPNMNSLNSNKQANLQWVANSSSGGLWGKSTPKRSKIFPKISWNPQYFIKLNINFTYSKNNIPGPPLPPVMPRFHTC